MIVKFHVLQRDDETGETRHWPIFTQEWGLIMVGQQITFAGVRYQIYETEWLDMKEGVLKVVCLEIPGPVE